MSLVLPAGATAAEFTLRRFGRPVRLVRNTVSLGTGVQILLKNNPKRIFWMVQNIGIGAVYIDFSQRVTESESIVLGANGGLITMDVMEDGEAVAWEIYGMSNQAQNNVAIMEIEAK